MSSVRLHSKALCEANKVTSRRSTKTQEQSFHKHPWKFAQSICRPPQKVDPAFSTDQCFQYFESITSTPVGYDGVTDWIQEVWSISNYDFEFDMSLIRPCEVKCVLKKCSSLSAPGNDNITYFHLKKLPS